MLYETKTAPHSAGLFYFQSLTSLPGSIQGNVLWAVVGTVKDTVTPRLRARRLWREGERDRAFAFCRNAGAAGIYNGILK
jgi:hypothetical protein